MKFSLCLCGEAGQGLQSIGNILLFALAKAGWEVFAHQDYESRVRGGSNFFQIMVADHVCTTFSPQADLLVSMAPQAYRQFSGMTKDQGLAVHPGPTAGTANHREEVISFEEIALEAGAPKVVASAAVAGFVWAFLATDVHGIEAELEEFFGTKGADIVALNQKVARVAYDMARARGITGMTVPQRPRPPRMLLQGNEAVALGAMAAGVKYISSYPMTPSTSIVEYIAGKGEEAGILVEQAEDEIAAINMAIGAAYAGARAMTTTSGGGLCLMTEAIGLAGSAEIPVVVVNGQRPGPSTGLPTRTEQGDLLFAIHAGHGDFPRAVLAPANIEDCFYVMAHAFNMAEEYHIPVIVLTDQHLADSFQAIPPLDPHRIPKKRGPWIPANREYRRYALTDSGVSPRVLPGTEPAVVVSVGDEHDEEGHLIEDAATRVAMMEKRMAKLELLRGNALIPQVEGSQEPELVLIVWGSVLGAAQQALKELKGALRLIHLPQLWPLPQERLMELIPPNCPVWTAEGNYSGQLATLLRMHGIDVQGTVRRYDGRPMTAEEIVQQIQGVM